MGEGARDDDRRHVTAAIVCERMPVRGLFLVNAMTPLPGETAGDWWQNTDATRARIAAAESAGYNAEFDLQSYYLHDLPEAVLKEGPAHQREEAVHRFHTILQVSQLAPNTDTRHCFGKQSFFPLEFQRRLARVRLKTDTRVVSGGHLVALSNPDGLVEQFLGFERECV